MIPVHVHRFGGMESKLYSIQYCPQNSDKEILIRADNVYYDTFFFYFQTFVL